MRSGESFYVPGELPGSSGSNGRMDFFHHHPPSLIICSALTVNPHIQSKILLLRDSNEPAFSMREIHLASLVLDEIPWLHWRNWKTPVPSLSKLSPRLQWTMDLLLLGLGRKEIADQIGISEGTVSGYIRKLYHQFGVNSQAELMRLRLQESSLPSPEDDKSSLRS
jgi:DNA-binding NarL/FixJ family response regulator